jgi:MATE family multidrug resistance protein
MTLPRTIVAAGAPAQPRRALWHTDMIETIRLAWPIALTQLGQIAMMTTDLALIGRLGEQAIAAVGLAHLILFVGFVLGMGPVSAVAPLAAQAFGARKPRLVRRSLRVGLWAAVIIGIPVNIAQLWGEELLIAAGQSSETAALAAGYLAGLTWSMIPAWCFIAFRNFMGAVNRPEPALAITLAAIPANGLLAYALIHGAFGLPRLDLLGAGLATTFVNAAMCVAAARRSSDRFAGRGHPVHDSVRYLACCDRARRARGRTRRSGCGAPGRVRRDCLGRRLHDRDHGDHRRAPP